MDSQPPRSGTTAASTDSGQGSGPLSDPYVAIAVPGNSKRGTSRRIMAPEGSSQLSIRRSMRVASSRERSTQPAAPSRSEQTIVEAPPGKKRAVGYVYEVLPAVAEHSVGSGGPSGNAGGSRDTATPQVVSVASPTSVAGRKRTATSDAPGSNRNGPGPSGLASAADFSPTHFEEPMSDGLLPPADAAQQNQLLGSPMASPYSTPISRNPLLRTAGSAHASSPFNQRSPVLRTRDGDAAWAAAEGLISIPEGLNAEGSASAPVIGGITYLVRSPGSSRSRHSGPSRRLFEDYTSVVQTGPQASAQAVPQLTTHSDTRGVGLPPHLELHIYSHAYSLARRPSCKQSRS